MLYPTFTLETFTTILQTIKCQGKTFYLSHKIFEKKVLIISKFLEVGSGKICKPNQNEFINLSI